MDPFQERLLANLYEIRKRIEALPDNDDQHVEIKQILRDMIDCQIATAA